MEQKKQNFEFERFDDNVIIHILQTEMRGLALIDKINDACRKQTSIGWIYPVLSRLEMQGLISSRYDPTCSEDKPRKLFKATRNGGIMLRNNTSKEISDFRDFGFAF